MEQVLLLHSPTLDTVMMIEETLRNAKEVVTIAELKRRVPRKVNHNTLKTVLSYLQISGKIEFTPYGIVWIFAPKEELSALMAKGMTWKSKKLSRSLARRKKR